MPQETRKSPQLTLTEVTHIAQKELLARGGHAPTVIIEGDQQTVAARIEPIAPTREGRAQQMFFLGFSLAQSGEVGVLQQVFFISEAWLSRSETGKPLEQPPSEEPQRKEVVIIAHHTVRPPRDEIIVFEMKRDPQGILNSLETLHPQEDEENQAVHSPLVEAFVIGFLGSALTSDG